MKAFPTLVVFALATSSMGTIIERRAYGPWTCPTKQQCIDACKAAGLVRFSNNITVGKAQF